MIIWIDAIAFIAGVVAMSLAGFLLLRRTTDAAYLAQHNDVAGFIYSAVGIIYGVLLAFIVVIAWQHFEATKQAVADEASVVAQIYRDVDALPASFSGQIRAELRDYVKAVVADGWPAMREGRGSARAGRALDQLWRRYATFVPQDANDKIWYAEILHRLNSLVAYRRARIDAASYALPRIMWAVLGIGGVITIGFSFLFGTANIGPHVVMVGALAATLALAFLLIWSLEHSFSGFGYVGPGPMRDVLAIMNGS